MLFLQLSNWYSINLYFFSSILLCHTFLKLWQKCFMMKRLCLVQNLKIYFIGFSQFGCPEPVYFNMGILLGKRTYLICVINSYSFFKHNVLNSTRRLCVCWPAVVEIFQDFFLIAWTWELRFFFKYLNVQYRAYLLFKLTFFSKLIHVILCSIFDSCLYCDFYSVVCLLFIFGFLLWHCQFGFFTSVWILLWYLSPLLFKIHKLLLK